MLNKDFLSGHYQKAIEGSFDLNLATALSDVPSLIGSLCFSGKLIEAKKLYKESYQVLGDNEKAACRFFLALGHTRKSQYQKAFKIYQKNLQSLHKKSHPLQKFYVYQGIAFYLFFVGKLEVSRKWALKSFDAAIDSKDIYAKSLATDLLGHLKLRLGEINVGLELLKSAGKLSEKIGNKGVLEATEMANLQYQAFYGYARSNILGVLEKKFAQLVSEDNYGRAGLGLELARQYTLRARYDLAEKTLEDISSIIFATENRRQEIQLNLRFAENYYQMGKSGLAWNYLRSARRCLNFEVDKSFEVQILGFEHKLADQDSKAKIKDELQKGTRFFNTLVNQNILSRNGIDVGSLSNHEDAYHDFLLSLEAEEDKVSRIIESGYYTLLWDAMEIKRGQKVFYFDQKANKTILFTENKIEIPEGHLTPSDTKLLLAIISGHNSKSEICKHVWGYDYDPLRHDNVIYTAVRSLRKNLSVAASWIETSENGYHFSNQGKFIINYHLHALPSEQVKFDLDFSKDSLSSFGQLNLRQIKSMNYLKKNEYLDVTTYQKIFKVSEVTASRDLRSLKNLGFVVTVGKARAVKYLLP